MGMVTEDRMGHLADHLAGGPLAAAESEGPLAQTLHLHSHTRRLGRWPTSPRNRVPARPLSLQMNGQSIRRLLALLPGHCAKNLLGHGNGDVDFRA